MKQIFTLSSFCFILFFSSHLFAGGGGGGGGCMGGTSVSCGNNYNSNTGNCVGCDPTNNNNGGQCCWAGADLDCDGTQDVTYSVENTTGFTFTIPAGTACGTSFTFTVTTTANLQGAIFNTTQGPGLDYGAPTSDEFGSGFMGGGTFTLTTSGCGGDVIQVYVDGYAGTTGSFTLSVPCPASCTVPTTVNAGSDITICEGSSATLTGSHTGGSGTVWRKWSNGGTTINSGSPGSTTATVSPTATTTYTYTVCMDGVGTACCKTDQVTVTVTPTFTPNAGANVTICPGGSSSLGGSPTGPAGSTYSWSCSPCDADISLSSSTVANPTVNIAGGGSGTATYTVTVTNGACVKTDQVVVTIGPVVANAGVDNSVCPGSSITIGGSPTGPAGSTYSWSCTANCDPDVTLSSSTSANPVLSVSSSQTAAISPQYTVTVTLGSCSPVTDAITITVNAKPATPAATASVTPICAGASSTLSVTGPLGGTTYTWWTALTGGSNLGTGTSLAVTPLSTTTYYIQASDNTTGCLSSRGSVTVTVNPTPVATAGIDQEECEGTAFSLSGSCSNCGSCSPNQTWTVLSGSGTFSPNANTTNANFTPTSTGTISLKLTPCSPGGCTPVADTVTLIVNPNPAVTASIQNDTMCVSQITTLDATGSGGTPFPPTVVPTTFNSTSSASITDANSGAYNCGIPAAVIPISVSGITASTVGGSVTVSICLNITHPKASDIDSIILCAPGGSPCITLVSNGTIGGAGANLTSTCFSDASATDIGSGSAPFTGTFNPQGTVAMTDLNGAFTNGTWTLSVHDCKTNNVGTFDSWSITISEAVSTNPYTIVWSSSTGITDTASSSTFYSSFGVSAPATITKTVTITDSKGCIGTATTATYIDAATAIVSGGGAICSGDSVSLSIALTGVGPWDLTYDIDGVAQTPITGIAGSPYTFFATSAGIYDVSAISDNYCNGTSSGNATVTVSSAPTPSITASGALTFCQGGNVNLDAGTFTGYLWSTGAATQTINVTTSGTYTVTVTNAGGCTGTDSKTVIVNPNPTTTASNNGPVCAGNSLTLTGGAGGMTGYSWSGPASFSNSTQSPTVSVSATTAMSGTYTITITDVNGCTGTNTTTVTVNSLPIATASNNGSVCVGNSLSLTGGAGGMTGYSWSGPASFSNSTQSPVVSASATTAMSGIYTITITDVNGCTGTNTTTVTVNSLPTATASNNGPVCVGNSLSLTGGAGGMTGYSWSGPASFSNSTQSPVVSASATTAMSGIYTITITDGNGCTGTNTTTVTVNSNPVAVITPSPSLSFCPGESITLTSDPANNYSWSTGANTQAISVSTSGTFTVTVTNGSGCTDSQSATTSVSSAITLSTSFQNSNCGFSDGKVSVSATGSGPFTYLWNTSPAQTTDTATGLPAGNYNITVTDNNGCTETATAGISDIGGPTPTLTITGATTFCDGDSVTLTSSVADSWLWSSGETTQSIVVKTSGTYSVAVVIGGCSGTSSDTVMTVNSNPVPVISANGPTAFCQGDSVTLNAGGGFANYAWSTLESSQTINVNTSGTFDVTVTNSNGCTGTASQSVTVNSNPTPTITPGGATIFCSGGNVTLSSSAASSYSWSTTEITQNITASATGTYLVTVTDGNGCTGTTSQSVTVNSNPTPTVTPGGATTFCQGDSVLLTATAASTYSWSTTETTQNITASSSGTYTVTVTDGNNCTGTASQTVTVNSNPVLSITPNGPISFCSGGNQNLDAGSGFTSYSWSTGVSTQTINVTSSGTYAVTVTNSGTCSSSDSVAVTVSSALTPSISANGPTSFCQGGSVDLDAGGGYTSYDWSTIETTQTITVSAGGTYTVTVTDASGCTGTDNISVTVNSNPTATITSSGATTFCQGDSVLLSATAAAGYFWNTGATTQSIYASSSGDFVVTITDANGCSDASDTTAITVNPAPNPATAASGSTTFCQGGSVTLSTVAASGYLWSNGSTLQSTVIVSTGNYTVTVTDGNGCTAVSTPIVVTVNPNPAPSITPSSSTTFCSNDSITLTSTAGSSYLWSTGETTQSIVVNAAGNYVVTMTNSSGCSGTSPALTVSVNPSPAPVIDTIVTISCDSTSIAMDGGTGYSDYLWSTGATSQIITVTTSGNYDVTVTDFNGCEGISPSVPVTLTQPTPINISVDSTDANCGGADGTATATATGGTTPYSYLWSNSQTGATATSLVAGNYNVTITDFNGCSQSASATVNNVGGFTATATATDAGCNGGANGTATATPAGGASPFIYLWSDGQTAQTATGLQSGTYNVTVTDSLGCFFNANAIVSEPSLLTASAAATGVACSGNTDGTATVTAGGGITPYTFLWSDGQITATATGLSGGTISVTVTDNNSCTSTQTITVNQPAPLSASATFTNETCGLSNGTATVSSVGGTTPYTYLWSTSQTGTIVTSLSPGIYSVTVTDFNNCTSAASVTIGGTGAVTVTTSANDVLCNGANNGDATATANGGATPYSYLWSDGQITQTATGLSGGNYLVTITDSAGCTVTDSATVNEPTAIVATTNATDVTCNGDADGTATVNASGGNSSYTYLWTDAQTLQTATGLSGGSISVTVSDGNCSAVFSISVTEPTSLSASPTKTDATCGNNNGTVAANATGGTSPYTYVWSTTPMQNSDTAIGLFAGTYSVTITDNNGCTYTASATVSGSIGPTVITTDTDVLCNGDSTGTATANASGGATPYTYSWGTTPSQNSATATGLAANTYYITVTDSNNCTTVDSAMVSQPAAILTATILPTNVSCNGGGNGSATATATGGTTNYSYLWSGGQTTQIISGLDTGAYTVTITDANLCTYTQTATISEPEALNVTIVPNTPCGAISGNASASPLGGTSSYSYLWTDGQTGASATSLVPGNYSVTVTDANGCIQTASTTVSIAPLPNIIKSKDTTVFQDTEITLFASGGVSYAWSTVPPETAPSFSITPEETTTYYVTVTNAAGCSKVDSVKITVENKYVIYVPSMFSPNVDGNNDAVFVRGIGINTINFAVYDRWGEKVFETTDITIGWDGKYKGKEMNSAVFVYVLNATMDDGNTVEKKGNITLVR